MSFYSFTEGAQGVTTISDAPEPVASALAQANWSRPLTSGRRKRRHHLAT
jgi:hypothetical protein